MGRLCRSDPWVFRAVLGGKQSHTWEPRGSLRRPQDSTLVRPPRDRERPRGWGPGECCPFCSGGSPARTASHQETARTGHTAAGASALLSCQASPSAVPWGLACSSSH